MTSKKRCALWERAFTKGFSWPVILEFSRTWAATLAAGGNAFACGRSRMSRAGQILKRDKPHRENPRLSYNPSPRPDFSLARLDQSMERRPLSKVTRGEFADN